jgi:sec-independent protein translocase protein TatC
MAKRRRRREEATFFEHLDELRVRIGRSLLYITCGMIAAVHFRTPLLTLLEQPARVAAKHAGLEELPFLIFEPTGGFVLVFVMAFVVGVVISSPLWLLEGWLFIEPALERHERRYVVFMLPAATALFVGGVAFCYVIAPRAFEFFFKINQSLGVRVELTLVPYLYFLLRLLLGFGFSFELPLVLMFLGRVGLVNSRWLLRFWRHAVVVIFIFSAVVTPTVDPFTMTIMALPLSALYFLSIILVRAVEKKRAKDAEEETEGDETQLHLPPAEGEDWEDFYGLRGGE